MLECSPANPIELGPSFELVRERSYGDSMVRVLRKDERE